MVTFRNENTSSTESKTDRNLPSVVFLASMNRAMVRILRTFLLYYVSYYLFKYRLGDRTFKPTYRGSGDPSLAVIGGFGLKRFASGDSSLTTCKQAVGSVFETCLLVAVSTPKSHPRVTDG